MLEESKRDKDIEEIFLHVKQIKTEQYKLANKREDELDSSDILPVINDGASYEARLVVVGSESNEVCSSR